MARAHIAASLLSAILLVAGRSSAQDYTTLRPILDVLRQNHLSGSLQYRGCRDVDQYVVPGFPIISTPPNTSGPPLQVLREMFAQAGHISVTQDTDGTIRIADDNVPQDLLNVKIAHLSFEDGQKKNGVMFSPVFVIGFIISAPEIRSFMKKHDIGQSSKVIDELFGDKPPFVLGELNNVTLAQALDYMAKSLHGLWVYKECPGDKKHKRIVDISFFRSGEQ